MNDANAIDVREANIRAEFDLLESQINDPDMRARITAALPSTVPFAAFRNATLAAMRANPDLLWAPYRGSLIAALERAAAQGLVPDGREGALIPRKSKTGKMEIVWQPMVAGMKKLAFKAHGALIDAHVVYEGEEFLISGGDEESIHHVIDFKCIAKGLDHAICVYAIARLSDGRKKRKWLPASYIRGIKARAQSLVWRSPQEVTMWEKTPIHGVCRDLDMSLPTEDAERLRSALEDDAADFDGVIAQGVPQIAAPAPSVNPLDLLDAKLAERDGHDVPEIKKAPGPTPQPKRRGRPPKAESVVSAAAKLAEKDATLAGFAAIPQRMADGKWLDDRMIEITAISDRSTYTAAVRAMILSPEYVAIKERMPEAVRMWTNIAEDHFKSLPVPNAAPAEPPSGDAVWVDELLADIDAAKTADEYNEIVASSADEVTALEAENPAEASRCREGIAKRRERFGAAAQTTIDAAAARAKAEKFVGWVRNKIAENHDLDGNPDAKFIAHLFAQEKAKTAVAIISADPTLADLAAELVKIRGAA